MATGSPTRNVTITSFWANCNGSRQPGAQVPTVMSMDVTGQWTASRRASAVSTTRSQMRSGFLNSAGHVNVPRGVVADSAEGLHPPSAAARTRIARTCTSIVRPRLATSRIRPGVVPEAPTPYPTSARRPVLRRGPGDEDCLLDLDREGYEAIALATGPPHGGRVEDRRIVGRDCSPVDLKLALGAVQIADGAVEHAARVAPEIVQLR